MPLSPPTFLGIGAQKAGTTWLSEQLRTHPEVWMHPIKELHYFDRSPDYPSPNHLATTSLVKRLFGSEKWERQRTMQGLRRTGSALKRGRFEAARAQFGWYFGTYSDRWYVHQFSGGRRFRVRGEISPSYSILNGVDVARIAAINPEIRLIYLIRDPRERAWSQLRFHVRVGAKLDLDATDAIIGALKRPGVILRGDYARTLDTYLDHFPPSQLLVGFYDAIRRDPVGLLNGVSDFLGINAFAEMPNLHKQVNASPQRAIPDPVAEYLNDFYARDLTELASRFGSYALRWERLGLNGEAESEEGVRPDRMEPVVHP